MSEHTIHQPRELLVLTEASRAIASLRTIDEAKDLRDKAEAVKAYARKARLGREIFVEASIVKARAERRLGEMLRETPLAKATPGNQHTGPARGEVADGVCTLESLGLTKSDSSRLQRVASLPQETFEEHVAINLAASREVTTAGLLRLLVAKNKPTVVEETPTPLSPAARRVNALAELIDLGERFATVYADPPWPGGRQTGVVAYLPMTVEAICGEPVARIVADQAHLHLWTPSSCLPAAIDVMDAWGFEPKSCFVSIASQQAKGDYWRDAHQLLLLGVRGGLPFVKEPRRSWLKQKPGNEARPESIRRLIQQVSPPTYLQVYGHEAPLKSDWTVYGNQLG